MREIEYFGLWTFSIRWLKIHHMKSPNSLGRVIASLRSRMSLSQEGLAERAGVHRTYISQLERDLKSPTLDTLRRIAAALRVRTSALVQMTEKGTDEL